MADIFVSYASEDRARVAPLVAVFKQRGWSVWWDRELAIGPSFDEKIEAALQAARCVVVVWSRHSTGKRWVRAEATDGLERDVLVPLLIDDVRPPLVFRSSQSAQLIGWPEHAGEIDAVISAVSRLISGSMIDVVPEPPVEQTLNSVAVLPFVNLGADPDQEYFADGITEDLIDRLGKHTSLRVIARTSCFYFKNRAEDVRSIGRRLGVSHIVEGSVRRIGNRIRVTAQLVRSRDGGREWSERFDREIDDVFAIQDEISSEVTRQLTHRLVHELPAYRPQRQAYDLFLKGQAWLRRVSFQGSTRSREFFHQALEIDPGYAEAHVAMAKAYMNERLFSYAHTREALKLAADHVDRALALNSDLGPALLQRAVVVAQQDCNIQSAIDQLRLVQKQMSSRYEVLDAAATIFDYAGRPDLVEAIAKEIVQIDPVGITGYLLLQVAQMSQGKLEDAKLAIESLLAIEPKHDLTLANMADLLARQGKIAEALDVIDRHGLHAHGQACFVYAAARRPRAIEEMVSSLRRRSGLRVFLTHAYALLGNVDGVLESLSEAIENRDPSLSHFTGKGIYHNCVNVLGERLEQIYSGKPVQSLLGQIGFDREAIDALII